MFTTGSASSSRIVTVACETGARSYAAFVVIETMSVSSGSSVESSTSVIESGADAAPVGIVSVPEGAVKSLPATAVPVSV